MGRDLIQQVVEILRDERFRGKIFLLENYDIRIARRLVQGVDVWLNTPRRPYEASGTSGQKVVVNGLLNLSTSDGWWPEGFDGTNGWTIGPVVKERQDARMPTDTGLRTPEVPWRLFYDRDVSGVPEVVERSSAACDPWRHASTRRGCCGTSTSVPPSAERSCESWTTGFSWPASWRITETPHAVFLAAPARGDRQDPRRCRRWISCST